MGQSPAVQPRQLVEDEHPSAPEPERPLHDGQLLVDQLYANVNVAGLIKQGLPTQLQAWRHPPQGRCATPPSRAPSSRSASRGSSSLWAQANRAADQTFIDIVNGRKGTVGVNQGAVSLDLGVDPQQHCGSRLGLPSDIASKLPPSIANLSIFKSNQLKYVQNGGKAIKGLALWLTIIVPLLYMLALLLAKGHRRRTLMTIGFAGILAGVLVILGPLDPPGPGRELAHERRVPAGDDQARLRDRHSRS